MSMYWLIMTVIILSSSSSSSFHHRRPYQGHLLAETAASCLEVPAFRLQCVRTRITLRTQTHLSEHVRIHHFRHLCVELGHLLRVYVLAIALEQILSVKSAHEQLTSSSPSCHPFSLPLRKIYCTVQEALPRLWDAHQHPVQRGDLAWVSVEKSWLLAVNPVLSNGLALLRATFAQCLYLDRPYCP